MRKITEFCDICEKEIDMNEKNHSSAPIGPHGEETVYLQFNYDREIDADYNNQFLGIHHLCNDCAIWLFRSIRKRISESNKG